MLGGRINAKRSSRSSAPASLMLRTCVCLLVLLGPLAHSPVEGQYLQSPCPNVFVYRTYKDSTQAYGYVELRNLPIDSKIVLKIALSVSASVTKDNAGHIELVKSNKETLSSINTYKLAKYFVIFPYNTYPNVLSISVNGRTICTGQKATGRTVTTINLSYTFNPDRNKNLPVLSYQPAQTPQQGAYSVQTERPQSAYSVLTQRPREAEAQGAYGLRTQSDYSVPTQGDYTLRTQGDYSLQTERPPVVQTQRAPETQTRKPQVIQTQRPVQSTPASEEDYSSEEDDSSECGQPVKVFNHLSIKGIRSKKGQFPWAAPIFDNSVQPKPKYICGSTIISTQHLVTAAHCMFDSATGFRRQADDVIVVPGMFNIDNFFNADLQERNVSTITIHDDYFFDESGLADSDIAVLKVDYPIVYNDLVRPICLWSESDNLEQIIGLEGFVSGWGITENGNAKYPSHVTGTVVDRRSCSRNLEKLIAGSARLFCADGHGSVPCTGDSGSGFVIKRGPKYYQRGIVSFGQFDPKTLNCAVDKYVVFTDIAPFRYWLSKVVQS